MKKTKQKIVRSLQSAIDFCNDHGVAVRIIIGTASHPIQIRYGKGRWGTLPPMTTKDFIHHCREWQRELAICAT